MGGFRGGLAPLPGDGETGREVMVGSQSRGWYASTPLADVSDAGY